MEQHHKVSVELILIGVSEFFFFFFFFFFFRLTTKSVELTVEPGIVGN